MTDFVVVGNYDSVYDASAAKSFVESAGIFCELKNEFNYQTMRIIDITGSTIQLLVRKEDCAAAIQALLDHKVLRELDLGPDKNLAMVSQAIEESPTRWFLGLSYKLLQNVILVVLVLILILIFADGMGNFVF